MNDKVKGHNKKFMNCHLSEATQKVSLLQEDPEHLHWHCALTPDGSAATVSNPTAFEKNSPHACVQIPHTNQNQCTKHDDIRGSLTNNVRNNKKCRRFHCFLDFLPYQSVMLGSCSAVCTDLTFLYCHFMLF